MLNKMNYGKYAILLFSPQGIESIKSEMEDIGEPLVDINFGHGRYSYEIVIIIIIITFTSIVPFPLLSNGALHKQLIFYKNNAMQCLKKIESNLQNC